MSSELVGELGEQAGAISVVVTAHHADIAQEQLAQYPGVELVVQPRNLDTGPGLLLPLVRVMARAPGARVIFLPSDHHVSSPAPLARALRETGSDLLADRICLLGVTPTGPEVEYGWIVRGDQIGQAPAFAVRAFHEKPGQAVADALWRGGELWNTFISAGPAAQFWALAVRHLPEHATWLARYAAAIDTSDEGATLSAAYDAMTPANFSRAVLSQADQLAVVPIADSGWRPATTGRRSSRISLPDSSGRLIRFVVRQRTADWRGADQVIADSAVH